LAFQRMILRHHRRMAVSHQVFGGFDRGLGHDKVLGQCVMLNKIDIYEEIKRRCTYFGTRPRAIKAASGKDKT
jgi:hypothetical protein